MTAGSLALRADQIVLNKEEPVPYDFNDQLVYNLISTTHLPEETGGFRIESAAGGVVATEPLRLVCRKDGEDWPCAAVKQLRAFDEQRRGRVFAARAPQPEAQRGSRG